VSYPGLLDSEFEAFQIQLPTGQKALLAQYCSELERWNQRINLTGLTGKEMVRRLVVEPVWIGLKLGISGTLADIGSGNGSPAIPLHITRGLRASHLIEARMKRVAFLRHIVSGLKLQGVDVHRGRLEDLAPDLKKVDWITLQGLVFDTQLFESINYMCSTTTVIVWITAGSHPLLPFQPSFCLRSPLTATEVFLFGRTSPDQAPHQNCST
jgi:16S rRNA (guanine(527)-N(7))-methyltransferase RsmG